MNTAKIHIRDLEFLKIGRIPIINARKGEMEETLEYPIVNGVMLVPLADAGRFNISPSTLRKQIKRGELTAYNENGTLRAANATTNIYWDPYQFYRNRRK